MIVYKCPTCGSPLWGRFGLLVCISCPGLVFKIFAVSEEIPDVISEENPKLQTESTENVERQRQTKKKGKAR